MIKNKTKENSSNNGHYRPYLGQIGLKQLLWVAVLPLCLALLVCTIPLGVAFGQNASQNSQNASGTNAKGSAINNGSGSNGGSSPAKNQGATPSNNKAAVVKVSPGSTATVTTAGNKTTVIASASSKTSAGSGSNNLALNKTGFTNTYVLTINGKLFPIKYTIKGGKLVGMLADKDRTTLVLVLNPSKNGGNMTIELPRNVIDSKGASNGDTKYQVKIDGKGVDYKELANNAYARILAINFSKDNRFMEVIGTKIAS